MDAIIYQGQPQSLALITIADVNQSAQPIQSSYFWSKPTSQLQPFHDLIQWIKFHVYSALPAAHVSL